MSQSDCLPFFAVIAIFIHVFGLIIQLFCVFYIVQASKLQHCGNPDGHLRGLGFFRR